MEVYLDDVEITKEIDELDQDEILDEIQKRLDNSIISEVHLDEQKVNMDYFQNNELDLNSVEKIKFVSKKTEDLITETLQEAKDYLPKLNQGVEEISRMLKRKEQVQAGNKLMLAIEGFRWYTGVLDNIKSLIDSKELQEEIEKSLEEFNELFSQTLEVQKAGKTQELADILVGDISKTVDEFIQLNERLLNSNEN